ncbi:prolyl oligopeptidase family serine peptidase [Aquimarina sp. M1]
MKNSVSIIKTGMVIIMFISCKAKKYEYEVDLINSVSVVDSYHGQKIEDSYRNIEDLEDSTVVDWLRKQGDFAYNILKKIPARQSLIDKQSSYEWEDEFSYRSVVYSENGKFFFKRKKIGEENYKLYYKSSLEAEEISLYDPKAFKDGSYRISFLKPDSRGNNIAIGLSKRGEQTSSIITLNVETKEVSPRTLTNCVIDFAGIYWLSDNSGFIYLYSSNNDVKSDKFSMEMQSVLYKLGSDPNKQVDIFSKKNNPELNLQSEDFPIVYNWGTHDGYLFAVVGGADSFYDVYYKKESDILLKNSPWLPLYKKSDKIKSFRVDNKDNLIYLSAKNSSYHQILKTPMSKLDFDNPEILVPENSGYVITKFHITKDGIYYTTKKNGVEAKLYHLEKDKQKEIKLPKSMGQMNIQSQSIEQDFLKISARGYLTPITHYLYDLATHEFAVEPIKPIKEYPEFNELVVEHMEIPSHDGELVPISIIRNKNNIINGEVPTLLMGYGAYGGAGSTSFSPSLLTWVTEGGILVFSHVRGGGEKGEAWHQAGFKTTKPNTWRDMIATTEYMINKGYTNPKKTAIWGTSAGGICAGRAMTERPDLYQAVILTSPALNMLRSEVQPNGKNSIKEFGTVAIKEEFEALLEMDSYHHLEKGVGYPATFVTGGMKDGRVAIWDPAKFVAKLQAYNKNDVPTLFGVKFNEGHAATGATKMEIYELYSNAFSFALWQMGFEKYQPNF